LFIVLNNKIKIIKEMPFDLKVSSGSSNFELATCVGEKLKVKLTGIKKTQFADGECHVQILDNVRGCDVFLIQATSYPVNDNLMEMLLLVDALKRASVKRIVLVNTYYSYSRQDRKIRSRVPISAKLIAKMIEKSGVDHVLSVDLHGRYSFNFNFYF
jgi:ribose-phosphate pyrophosphokinase